MEHGLHSVEHAVEHAVHGAGSAASHGLHGLQHSMSQQQGGLHHAMLLHQLGRHADAAEVLLSALREAPAHAHALLLLGKVLRARGEWRQAAERFADVLRVRALNELHDAYTMVCDELQEQRLAMTSAMAQCQALQQQLDAQDGE